MALPIVAALDDRRFHWFHVPWWGCVLGYALLDRRNRRSDMGRVGEQVLRADRPHPDRPRAQGHRYRSLCHRPTSGIRCLASLLFIGMPLCLGSLWALIPGILLCPLLVLRTIWEDQTLRDELAGYEQYTQRVRYRLIPGVW